MRKLALQQVEELAAASGGAVSVIGSRDTDDYLIIDISLDTHGIQAVAAGITVRQRERFEIRVSDKYPFRPPSVWASHARWAGTPHVQWARSLCLYAASSVEWNPADGMRGFIERLISWLENAAAGTLDPDGQPLHPPVTYHDEWAGFVVVHPDVGDRVPWGDSVISGQTAQMFAWCTRSGDRVDVAEWMTLQEMGARVLADGFVPTDEMGLPFIVAPLALVSDELSMEYPDKGADLVASLRDFGLSREDLLWSITTAGTFNTVIASLAGRDNTAPVVVMLGTPARRVEGTRRLAHVTAWKFDAFGAEIMDLLREIEDLHNESLTERATVLANSWIDDAKVRWMVIHEDRPEVTNRRDAKTPAAWLRDKKVLVLGCGALGAPIAEHCVRAGVAALTVVDNSVVKPGILIRQPYRDVDIGYSKARQLAGRLEALRSDLTVESRVRDVIDMFVGENAQVPEYDLVIDATADVGVRAAIETARACAREQWPPVITGLFGHDAVRALALVSRPGATGSAHDMLRRIAIDAHANGESGLVGEVADDFFPHPPRTEMFVPEPGCSSPTFTGSAMQTTALASSVFWAAMSELADPQREDPMVAVAIALPGPGSVAAKEHWWRWPNDHVITDGRYEVRIAAAAQAEMRAETRRGARTRGERIETGGMLLGSFDEAMGCVYIDTAAGPSPDSVLSAQFFAHGTQGTQEFVEHHRKRSINRVGFVGMWHTHPYGPARPSPTDENGMGWIVSPSGTGRRALMLILGGDKPTWDRWREDGQMPNAYVRVVERDDQVNRLAAIGQVRTVAIGGGMPGGFYQPVSLGDHGRSWWQRVLGLRA
ncbi:ThiF family adenylyltransferase [Nocardia puris]|uniref:ThiF family adenylyltransferase n=1 Tax=Nocardia puris TaxID=208602 RepID=UPI00189448FA|nr:ThiF family adenylyltransferase [Nocardia puris]MBF6212148.1 ThiF family adenylyltransferase [Nocardia puris]